MAFLSPAGQDAFDEEVYKVVERIPYGKITTYGKIAGMMKLPEGIDLKHFRAFGARWVGGSMSRCPGDLPWQRVVNAKGEISPRAGATKQRELLEAEGIEFGVNGKIALKKYLWTEIENK